MKVVKRSEIGKKKERKSIEISSTEGMLEFVFVKVEGMKCQWKKCGKKLLGPAVRNSISQKLYCYGCTRFARVHPDSLPSEGQRWRLCKVCKDPGVDVTTPWCELHNTTYWQSFMDKLEKAEKEGATEFQEESKTHIYVPSIGWIRRAPLPNSTDRVAAS